MNHSALSIDPGLTATGIVVWSDGEPADHITINPPRSALRHARMLYLSEELWPIMTENAPSWVAIEEPEDFVPPERKSAMIPLGMAIGICYTVATTFGAKVIMQRKGTVPKSQADLLVRNIRGNKTSQHSRDALLIGYLANLDRLTRTER